MAQDGKRDAWTLLTSHGRILVEIARNPDARIKDLAAAASITERATAGIIADLEAAGYVTRQRVGRRNRYIVHLDLPFRHPAQRDVRVGPFLEFLADLPGQSTSTSTPTARQDVVAESGVKV
jgi:DNA-binding IclR family transcriptional regulator